jgi:hypothetical protein
MTNLERMLNLERITVHFLREGDMTVLGRDAVPDMFKTFYRMFLLLKIFSGTMETRAGKLYEVMPIAHETLR